MLKFSNCIACGAVEPWSPLTVTNGEFATYGKVAATMCHVLPASFEYIAKGGVGFRKSCRTCASERAAEKMRTSSTTPPKKRLVP